MLQSSFLDRVAFGPFAVVEDGLSSSEVDIGGCQVLQALVVAAEIVVLDEAADVRFEISGQVIIFEQDSVLKRLMSALDLALRLRMIRRSANMLHADVFEPLRQVAGDVT